LIFAAVLSAAAVPDSIEITKVFLMKKLLLISGVLLMLVGCGSGVESPDFAKHLTPVFGQVLGNGTPVAGAAVTFIPDQNKGAVAYAVTDDAGLFDLHTPISGATIEEMHGAVPGRYRVIVSRILMPDGSPIAADTTEADAMAIGAKETVPLQFSDPERTQLAIVVSAEQMEPLDLSIEL
jgi:hypothetical protein